MVSSLRRVGRSGRRSVMTAFFCRFSGMPPNLVTSGFLPGRSTVAWKQTRGPCGVVMVVRCLRRVPGSLIDQKIYVLLVVMREV